MGIIPSELGNHFNHLLECRGKPRQPVSRWPVAGHMDTDFHPDPVHQSQVGYSS